MLGRSGSGYIGDKSSQGFGYRVPESTFPVLELAAPPEETEHGTRPGGRGPGGVPGGAGSKNRGGGMCAYIEGVYPYTEGSLSPIAILSVCLCVCPSHSKLHFYIWKVFKLYFFI